MLYYTSTFTSIDALYIKILTLFVLKRAVFMVSYIQIKCKGGYYEQL